MKLSIIITALLCAFSASSVAATVPDLSQQDIGFEDFETILLSTNTNPETCTSNCRCPLSNPSCTLAACTSNCKCQNGGCAMPKCTHNCKCQGGKCDMPSCGSNCKCQSGGCPMPVCTQNCKCQSGNCPMPQCVTACKCTLGGCSASVEQEEFLEEIESTESESKPVGNTSSDEEFPPCVTPAYNGEDQRGCGPGAVCMGAKGNQGCNQDGLVNPSCVTSGCSQQNTINASCVGGKCDQRGAHNPSCTGSNCCWDEQTKNGSCTWGCGPNAKGCPRRAEEGKTFLRAG